MHHSSQIECHGQHVPQFKEKIDQIVPFIPLHNKCVDYTVRTQTFIS